MGKFHLIPISSKWGSRGGAFTLGQLRSTVKMKTEAKPACSRMCAGQLPVVSSESETVVSSSPVVNSEVRTDYRCSGRSICHKIEYLLFVVLKFLQGEKWIDKRVAADVGSTSDFHLIPSCNLAVFNLSFFKLCLRFGTLFINPWADLRSCNCTRLEYPARFYQRSCRVCTLLYKHCL